jgi:hypothetical protein
MLQFIDIHLLEALCETLQVKSPIPLVVVHWINRRNRITGCYPINTGKRIYHAIVMIVNVDGSVWYIFHDEHHFRKFKLFPGEKGLEVVWTPVALYLLITKNRLYKICPTDPTFVISTQEDVAEIHSDGAFFNILKTDLALQTVPLYSINTLCHPVGTPSQSIRAPFEYFRIATYYSEEIILMGDPPRLFVNGRISDLLPKTRFAEAMGVVVHSSGKVSYCDMTHFLGPSRLHRMWQWIRG